MHNVWIRRDAGGFRKPLLCCFVLMAVLFGIFVISCIRDYMLHDPEYDNIIAKIEPEYRNMCRDILAGKPRSFAQGWQDWVVYHNYFKHYKWGSGIYVDIGTNDPLVISNTVFFDKCLGWKGLCIEPQQQYHSGIRKNRGCTLVPSCVLGDETTVSFQGIGGGAGIQPILQTGNESNMQCRSIVSVLQHHGIDKVDFLNIDIESSESEVLRCWPFLHINVNVILIETDKADQREVDLFFHRHGYSNVETFLNSVGTIENWWIDSLYVMRRPHVYPPPFVCDTHDAKFMGAWCATWQNWKSGVTKWGMC